jgi:Leucine-rich repeat (LRR) protein
LADEADAARELAKLDFKVVRDQKQPGNPVVIVDFSTTKEFHANDALMPKVAQFKKLHTLNMRSSYVTGAGLKLLQDLKELHTLNLGGTKHFKDNDLIELKNLRAVRWVSVSGSSVTDAGLKDLKEMPNLQHLDLSATRATDAGMRELKEFKNLQSLALSTGMVTIEGLKELKLSKTLRGLSLSGKKFTYTGPIDPEAIKALEEFDRNSASVTDTALANLKEVKGFVRLDLFNTKVTDAGVKQLKDLRELQELDLKSTTVTDAALNHLKDSRKLIRLNISNTKVTDAGMKHLKDLKDLKMLRMSQTAITDAGVKDLRALKGLTFLDLAGTKITDAALTDLHELSGLEQLGLGRTAVSDDGLKALRGMKALINLNLEYTHVTKTGVEALARTLPEGGGILYQGTADPGLPKIDPVVPPKQPIGNAKVEPKKQFPSSVIKIDPSSNWNLAEARARTPLFSDRTYTIEKLSLEIAGGTLLLRGADECKTWLPPGKVTALKDCTAYLAIRWKYLGKALDDGMVAKLTSDGWTDVKGQLVTSFPKGEDWQWKVLQKKLKKGEVVLAPNINSNAAPLLFIFKGTP